MKKTINPYFLTICGLVLLGKRTVKIHQGGIYQ